MNDLNLLSLVGAAGAACVVIASVLWYRIGKRKGAEVAYNDGFSFGEELGIETGYRRGYEAGKAQGWSDRHFEQIAKERKIRDKRTGRYKSQR